MPFRTPTGRRLTRAFWPERAWRIHFSARDPIGTYRYAYRLYGLVSVVRTPPNRFGPAPRLVGTFGLRGEKRSNPLHETIVRVPAELAARVARIFRENPKTSSRDRRQVAIDVDVWAVKGSRFQAPRFVCTGRVGMPDFFRELEHLALKRERPEPPTAGSTIDE